MSAAPAKIGDGNTYASPERQSMPNSRCEPPPEAHPLQALPSGPSCFGLWAFVCSFIAKVYAKLFPVDWTE